MVTKVFISQVIIDPFTRAIFPTKKYPEPHSRIHTRTQHISHASTILLLTDVCTYQTHSGRQKCHCPLSVMCREVYLMFLLTIKTQSANVSEIFPVSYLSMKCLSFIHLFHILDVSKKMFHVNVSKVQFVKAVVIVIISSVHQSETNEITISQWYHKSVHQSISQSNTYQMLNSESRYLSNSSLSDMFPFSHQSKRCCLMPMS